MSTTYFAVGDMAAHDGAVTQKDGPAWPVEGGWTEQDVTGAHGRILYEGESRTAAQEALDAFLACDAPATGMYCYTHNPEAVEDACGSLSRITDPERACRLRDSIRVDLAQHGAAGGNEEDGRKLFESRVDSGLYGLWSEP